jgi:hypothetical protein
MKLLKISSVGFFILLLLFLSSPVFATGTETTQSISTSKAVVITDLSIHNAKIISQKDNVFNISFDVTNKEGAQAGLKYNVKLIKEDPTNGGQFVADEYTYPDLMSISSNSFINKSITYKAPDNLSGEYTLLVTIENSNGLPISLGIAGKVKNISSSNTIQIDPESCFLSVQGGNDSSKYNLTQGIDISSSEKLVLNCNAENPTKTTVSGIPSYETHYRTMSGDVVSQEGGDNAPVSFKASEKKLISLILPKATKPQAYDIKIALESGTVSSNSIIVHYVLHGESATIQNFSLDKDYYNKKDIAKVSFAWSPSSDGFSGSRLGASSLTGVILTARITNDQLKECITPINKVLDNNGIIELSPSVITNCKNPIATVELTDAKGNILDQKIFAFESKIPHLKNSLWPIVLIVFGVLVVAGLAFYFINLKKKSNETDNK